MKCSKLEEITVFRELIFVLIRISLWQYLQKVSKLECFENKVERKVGQMGGREEGLIEDSSNLLS